MNKRKYELHVFIGSLYNEIQESHSKNILGNVVLYSTMFCPNMGKKNPYSRWFYGVIITPFGWLLVSKGFVFG